MEQHLSKARFHLLIKSLVLLQRVDPGFAAEQRLTFDVSLPASSYPGVPQILGFHQSLTRELEALPGVRSVAMVRNLPLRSGSRTEGVVIESREQQNPDANNRVSIEYQGASPGYFRTVGTPVLRGREFDDADRAGAPPVVLINETMARMYWPDGDPIGDRVFALFDDQSTAPWRTVVGIVGDVRHQGLDVTPRPELYLPLEQTPARTFGWVRTVSVIVGTASEPTALAPAIREVVRRADPNIPVVNLATLEDVVATTLTDERFFMMLLAVFAASALLIAAVGVYGVMSFSVAKRTHEIGVRMALGAQRREVVGGILRSGLRLAGPGAAIGIALALVSSRLLESQVYGVSVRDATVFTLGGGVLLAVAVVASWLPAHRASRTDPSASLTGFP